MTAATPGATASKSRFRFWPVALGTALFLALLLVGSDVYLRYLLRQQIRSHIATLKSRGEPVTEDDLIPAMPPETENAAFLYLQGFELLRDSGSREWAMDKRLEYLVDNLFEDSNGDEMLPSTEDRKQFQQQLDSRDKAFAYFNEADAKPKCQFPLPRGDDDWPFLETLRAFSRYLLLAAAIDESPAADRGPARHLAHALRLQAALRDDHRFSAILTRQRILQDCYVILPYILPRCRAVDELDNLTRWLPKQDMDISPEILLQSFRVFMLNRNQMPPSERVTYLLLLAGEPGRLGCATWRISHLCIRDELKALQNISLLCNAAQDRSAVEVMTGLPWKQFPRYSTIWMPLTALQTLEARHYCQSYQTHCTNPLLIKLAIALRRFQLRTGEFPPSLRSIPGDWTDPMNGQPLQYERKAAGGFALRGLGRDGKPDTGNIDTDDDWTWTMGN